MTMIAEAKIQPIANTLMSAVVRAGCIRQGNEGDSALAVRVMREEMKTFLGLEGDIKKYADERELVRTQIGRDGLALASIAVECIGRILKERAPQ